MNTPGRILLVGLFRTIRDCKRHTIVLLPRAAILSKPTLDPTTVFQVLLRIAIRPLAIMLMTTLEAHSAIAIRHTEFIYFTSVPENESAQTKDLQFSPTTANVRAKRL